LPPTIDIPRKARVRVGDDAAAVVEGHDVDGTVTAVGKVDPISRNVVSDVERVIPATLTGMNRRLAKELSDRSAGHRPGLLLRRHASRLEIAGAEARKERN
jgi:hypothetical protein